MILSQDFPGVLLSQINKIRIKGRRYSLPISGSNLESPHNLEVCLTYFQFRHEFQKLGTKWKYV